MALKGSLSSTDYQGRKVIFEWSATQNISKNQSTITWTLKGAGSASSSFYRAGPFYVSVAGTESKNESRVDLYEGTQVLSGSKTITHGKDGKATFKVEIKAAIYAADYNCSGSTTFTLDTIPRAATFTSAAGFTDEDTPTFKYDNPAGGTLQIGIYETDGTTAIVAYRACSGSSYKFTFTDAEKTALQKSCKSANSKKVRIYLKTTIGSNSYLSYAEKTLTINNGDLTISPVVADTNQKTFNLTGDVSKFVKYYSTATYNFNATARKQASMKSYTLENNSKSYTTATGEIPNITNIEFKFTAADSRGNSKSQTLTKTLVNYVKLTCSMDATAELAGDNTATINLSISGNYFNGSFGAVNNALQLWYRKRVKGGSWKSDRSDWVALTPTIKNNKYTCNHPITGNDYTKEYEIEVIAQDKLWEQYGNFQKSAIRAISAKPVYNWDKDEFNFNVPVKFSGDEWHDLTWGSNFTNYNSNTAYRAQYKVCGNVVMVRGIATAKSTITPGADGLELASGIPAAYRPSFAQHCVCQGSGANKWLLTVGSGGGLICARYGTTNYDGSIGTSTWLPFSFTYIV